MVDRESLPSSPIESDFYKALLEVSKAISVHRDLKALVQELSTRLPAIVPMNFIGVSLYQPDRQVMKDIIIEGNVPADIEGGKEWAVDDHPGGLVWKTQQSYLCADISQEKNFIKVFSAMQEDGVTSLCVVPLTTAARQLGALGFTSQQRATYDESQVEFLQLIGQHVAVAVDNVLAYEEIQGLKEQLEKENVYLREEIQSDHHFEDIIGESPALKKVLEQLEIVAPTESTVLILGETGTGKELLARALHQRSQRAGYTFVKLNCAAIPTGLLESELFGHERGAFTGAIAQKVGRFELAHGGTLFLDEVGEIPLELQSKLLRVLQEQEFERLGGTRTIRVDVRLVAATNRDLSGMVDANEFRSDLFYRLHVFPITVPALCDRPEDIPLLVRYFTQYYARSMKKTIESIPTKTMNRLSHYHWPGNVRELQNLIERAVILSQGSELHVPITELKTVHSSPSRPSQSTKTLVGIERDHIMQTLRDTGWVIGGIDGAAERLGMKRTTLISKMKKLNIERPT